MVLNFLFGQKSTESDPFDLQLLLGKTVMNENKPSKRWRAWRWVVYLLIGLAIPVGYVAWKIQTIKSELFGFQPPEMALAQYTPKDVIGDLGGMKVRIPRHYAEYVEYDGDPGFGEKRKTPIPERTFDSRLSSFGMNVRFPDMEGLENAQMREERRRSFLREDNPWISIGINAGQIYPKSGSEAADRNARAVTDTVNSPTTFWFSNYERLPDLIYSLEAYVVPGVDPRTGKPGRESDSTSDIYIHRATTGRADTYIRCGRTSVPGGVASCQMSFGLEPRAQVHLSVSFVRSRLSQWHEIRHSVIDFLTSFEIREEALETPPIRVSRTN